jgi:hypothetical protein
VLVDVKRESPRDVLRHAAGLNDSLVDLINVVAIADEAPTTQSVQVSEEVMAAVDAQIARLRVLMAGELVGFNAALRETGMPALGVAAG